MTAAGMPLPRWAWTAGDGRQSADHDTLSQAKALVPTRYDGFVPSNDAALRYGLALNDAGFFWESHEVLEAVWKAAPQGGRDRILLRACIQVANANLKRKMSRANALRKLLREALADLTEFEMRQATGSAASFAATFNSQALRAVIAKQSQAADETPSRFASDYATKYIFLAA
ncbi:DUF309 domain-containing protein [Tardiphaga sp.]|uniref:DUF309 domain-containing protein n=1 Tax=Tardiphaga sp. TaxID=1926292 RepID=UPI00262548F1|nr:DUF309 domain-containing protein [Tardiphaga sp.]MDB5618737.1 hypothetical protein [Tardiphaga sp.]